MKKTLDIKSVCECNRRLGCKTLHPQASIINLEHPDLEQEAVKFEFYAVLLIEECRTAVAVAAVSITTIPMPRWYFSNPGKFSA